MKRRSAVMGVALMLALAPLLAQPESASANQDDHRLQLGKTTEAMVIDGKLIEDTWKSADTAKDFWQKSPRDDIRAEQRTEAKVAYDDVFLYVAAICYDTGAHIIPTLKRDEYWDGDGFSVILDPVNRATSGFFFGTNPLGVQTEALLAGGSGDGNWSDQWDNRWFVETAQFDDHWTVEMAIPFKSLRYESGTANWGINFMRKNSKLNQLDTWAPVPLQFWPIDLGYTGLLEWDTAPEATGSNMAIVPYVSTSTSRDFASVNPADRSFSAGLDAKIAVSSALNLDLTVNPDFSQVEVDQQITNLTRFNIFLPERRTFFLENSDIFSRIGFPSIQPFFSRRLGLDREGRAVPIVFGARLTGNATKTTRVGLLNVLQNGLADQPAQNVTAAAVSQRVFNRSRLQALFVNRQGFRKGDAIADDYGRNLSFKFNYLNKEGSVEFWSGAHRSFKPGISTDQYFFENGVGYQGKRFSILFDHIYLGDNYFADVGFINQVENYDAELDTVVRLGYHLMYLPIEYRWISSTSSKLNSHGPEYLSVLNLDPQGKFVEHQKSISYGFNFKNSSQLQFGYEHTGTDLRFPFSFTDGQPLPRDRYRYGQASMEYGSDERKLFQFEIGVAMGSFYNGTIRSANLNLAYRRQPWGNFGVLLEYNRLSFPEPYGSTTLYAVSPRIEISFNRNLFWTTYVQYNTQADNLNINSRIQWRFAPMSDVFLVYTDNYSIETFGAKNRAIVLKASYWFVR
ncbi:MAG: carbohydrate binding family 9 domain-containing protein [Saprospiraceae bacterium]|nr:carbohydrate binding family 9 domain-containing protein [Saprospiraceae bacterium]